MGAVAAIGLMVAALVRGNRELLIQLTANLFQNAIQHGESGQTITLRVRGRLFQVSDEGPGVPVEEREKVLQPL